MKSSDLDTKRQSFIILTSFAIPLMCNLHQLHFFFGTSFPETKSKPIIHLLSSSRLQTEYFLVSKKLSKSIIHLLLSTRLQIECYLVNKKLSKPIIHLLSSTKKLSKPIIHLLPTRGWSRTEKRSTDSCPEECPL